MFEQGDELKLNREAVARYATLTAGACLGIPAVCLAMLSGRISFVLPDLFLVLVAVGLVVLAIEAYVRRWTAALSYRLVGERLEVESGLLFRSRVSMPLDGPIVVALEQSPVMRHCGIWRLRVQYAGAQGRDAIRADLLGVEQPEALAEKLQRTAGAGTLVSRHAT